MAGKNASAEFMREARKERGLSMKDAAHLIGVNVSTLRKYERDGLNRRMRFPRIAKIAKTYGTTIEELARLISCDLGAFLWTRREELGLSRVAMSERLGCTLGDINNLEFDGIDGNTSCDKLMSICVAYRVSSDDLLSRMA